MHLKPQCKRLLAELLVECMGRFSRAVRRTSRPPPLKSCRPSLPRTDNLSKTSVACDFNIDVLDHTNPLAQGLRDILTSFGLVWAVNTPTRVSATSSTAIDNVFKNVLDVSVSVLDAAISDHFAQDAVIGNLSPKIEPFSVEENSQNGKLSEFVLDPRLAR
ncbi:hypothetical protein J6590_024770 [Homalodisca vitripennis]|nr:hypothetical protein J6590_024770 [Homalodisca vitripennis]